MKKIIYIIAFTAVTLFSSCQLVDVLDKKPPYESDLDGAITTAKAAELALNGVYSYLPQKSSDWIYQPAYAFRSGLMSKPSWHTSGNAVYYYERNWPKLSSNSDTEWDYAYNIIKNANFLLTRLNSISDFVGNRREEIRGELHFMKGFAYHRLMVRYAEHWNLESRYGLLIRENTPAIGDDQKSRSSVKDSYQVILDNLDIAIASAPKYSDSGYGSILAAKAIKAKVLMDMQRYEECINLANEVIAEAGFEASYADIFDKAVTSKEIIFCRKFGDAELTNMSTRTSAIDKGNWSATPTLDSLMDGDPRKRVTIGDSIVVNYPYGTPGAIYKNTTLKKLNNVNNSMPIIFVRTAEMYLLKAEATMRNGGSIADSWAPIMVLRSRAGAVPETPATRELLEDEICNEWIRELGCENSSEWMAIRRMGVDKLLELNKTLKIDYDAATDKVQKRKDIEYRRILSIPLEEINSNPVEQNPGY